MIPKPSLHLLTAVALVFPIGVLQATEAAKPNIIVILADDMGYGDLGCSGSTTIKTPHIDRLAAGGVFCTRGYVASPVCSPSRAGLLTGRDPRRFGYEGNLNGNAKEYPTRPECLGLPTGEHTLADHLKAAGYRTGLVGKWHLGEGTVFHPNQRGFDDFCGMLDGTHTYFPTQLKGKIQRNGEPVSEFSSPYLTDFFTDEAIRWMGGMDETAKAKPFFLYLSYNAPHAPMEATAEDLKLYSHIEDKNRRTYAAMMHAMDRGIGRVLDWIKSEGKDSNTLIVFFSDNGGATSNGSWNGSLSGAKGTLLEGGVRVPMIWSWPRKIPAAKRYTAPVSSLDLLPTFLAAAGATPLPLSPCASHEDAENRERATRLYGAYDGINVLPYFTSGSEQPDRTLFWRLQGQRAVLHGEDKLISLSHRPPQLFQPGVDPGEATDGAATRTGAMKDLFRRLGEWESSLETAPLWDSSPRWWADSARIYDSYPPRPEPK
jgi:arylsulfatase A-like enzyme